jgi:hypothetical protein
MGTARSITSILGTAIFRGSKLLVKVWWAIRKARGEVKKSASTMYETLVKEGIPDPMAREIAVSYAAPGWELLQFRNIMNLVQTLD